jgi:hypothetical protein
MTDEFVMHEVDRNRRFEVFESLAERDDQPGEPPTVERL